MMTPKLSQNLCKKMNPRRFTSCSGKMHAILGWLVGEAVSDPSIAEFTVTSDEHVLARHEGDIGFNDFFAAWEDFYRNVAGAAEAAELTPKELAELDQVLCNLRNEHIPA